MARRRFSCTLIPTASLIADVFSRDYGRLPLLARGARRPKSALRGLLIGFQPLELGWFGAGEVKTLAKAEWLGGIPLLAGRCLLLGYYLNELLISLLAREDAHPILFDSYVSALQALAHGAEDAPELRKFEVRLLRELGYGLRLETDAQTGSDIDATRRYLICALTTTVTPSPAARVDASCASSFHTTLAGAPCSRAGCIWNCRECELGND